MYAMEGYARVLLPVSVRVGAEAPVAGSVRAHAPVFCQAIERVAFVVVFSLVPVRSGGLWALWAACQAIWRESEH